MADVLGLLREYHLNNKSIIENQDEIIFGKEGTPRDYYTLDCIVYLLKNIDLPHSQYVRQAATAQVPVVRFPDRRDLLAYLKGEANSAPSIDRTVPVDISIRRSVSRSFVDLQNLRRDHLDVDSKIDAKRSRLGLYDSTDDHGADEPYGSTDLKSGNGLSAVAEQGAASALPKAIPIDKIQSLRAKFRAKQQQTTKPDTEGFELAGADGMNISITTVGTVDGLLPGLGAASGAGLRDPGYMGPNSQTIIAIDDQTPVRPLGGDPTSARGVSLAADLEVVRVISSRERRWRNRTSILQSQGKTFYENIVLGILRNVMLKENAHLAPDHRAGGLNRTVDTSAFQKGHSAYSKAPIVGAPGSLGRDHAPIAPSGTGVAQPMQYSRYEQERFPAGREETAGFQIDTTGTYHGKGLASMVGSGGISSVPDATAISAVYRPPTTPLHPTKDPGRLGTPGHYGASTPRDPRSLGTPVVGMTPDPYRGTRTPDARVLARPKPRASRVPIIIIPAAPTSLITMLNAQDLLQDLRFVSNEEKRAQGCRQENELLIHRQKADGRTVPYRVVDQPSKLQADEWNRVVAVFVQGQAWQFKGWQIGSDPAVIFSMLKGFHLKYSNMPLDTNVAKWNVYVINLDRRRHLDKVNFQSVWDQLDKHIAKYKPFLRS